MFTDPTLVRLLLTSFALAALGGVSAVLRAAHPLPTREAISAAINGVLLGLSLIMLWVRQFQHDMSFLLVACVFAGLAARPMLDALSRDLMAVFRVSHRSGRGAGPSR